jgi:hypothetical protein
MVRKIAHLIVARKQTREKEREKTWGPNISFKGTPW